MGGNGRHIATFKNENTHLSKLFDSHVREMPYTVVAFHCPVLIGTSTQFQIHNLAGAAQNADYQAPPGLRNPERTPERLRAVKTVVRSFSAHAE